jgi:hypothetical protein
MRQNRCAIPCPVVNCQCVLNPLETFHRMPVREKARYKSILEDVTSNVSSLQLLKSAILDVMTLKCPTCSVPVGKLSAIVALYTYEINEDLYQYTFLYVYSYVYIYMYVHVIIYLSIHINIFLRINYQILFLTHVAQ